MKSLMLFMFLLIIESVKGQSGVRERHLIQDVSPIKEEKENVANLLVSDICRNSIDASEFLAMLKDNPLMIKQISKEQQDKNDFFIVKGKMASVDIKGKENMACEICFKYDYLYEFKMYLPIHEDFCDLKKGDLVYAFVNIGDIGKYEIVCDVALAASSPKLLAEKFIALVGAMQSQNIEELKKLLDVGVISSFYCNNCNFENSIGFFANYLQEKGVDL